MLDKILKGAQVVESLGDIAKSASEITQLFKKGTPNEDKNNKADGLHYSPELENLISMAIEDGELTDHELKIICKKGEKEGIEPLELEMVVRRRLKKRVEEIEHLKNPVNQLIRSFKLAEDCVSGNNKTESEGALSSMLSLMEGVSENVSIGPLVTSLIKTPSNLNQLKAEIINNIIIPDNEKFIIDFLVFAHSQRELEVNKNSNSKKSISGVLSKVTMGSELNLVPVWENKIMQLVNRGRLMFPDSLMLQNTIKQVYMSPTDKLRQLREVDQKKYIKQLETISVPADNTELIELLEYTYLERDDEIAADLHKKLYTAAEKRFSNNPDMMAKVKKYKIKKFGFF